MARDTLDNAADTARDDDTPGGCGLCSLSTCGSVARAAWGSEGPYLW